MTGTTIKAAVRKEIAWVRAQTLGTFTYADISDELKIDIKYVPPLVRQWEEAGWVKRVDGTGSGSVRLKFDVTAEPIRPQAPKGPGTPRGNMWRAMRMLKVFSPRDIAMQANTATVAVTADDARAYCQTLNTAGYFRVEQKADKFRPAIYRLVKNTGPKPPVLKRVRAIWDENRGEYTYIAGAKL